MTCERVSQRGSFNYWLNNEVQIWEKECLSLKPANNGQIKVSYVYMYIMYIYENVKEMHKLSTNLLNNHYNVVIVKINRKSI